LWLLVVEDPATGRRTFCSLTEGLGKVLRYGAYSQEVLDRLRWMADVLGPLLAQAVRAAGPVDVTGILTQMLQMGDEAHNRNRAGTLMLLRDLSPALVSADAPSSDIAEALRFIGANDHIFLNLAMPACKLALDAARGIDGSTMVVAMSRNGTEFGIQVAGTGDEWFTGPAQYPDGLFLGGYGPEDANPDIGDSAITETAGIGGFAMATAPAIVRFVGGTVSDAMLATRSMYEITLSENPAYALPVLDFRGAATGIDVTRVVRTGILPQINTGIAGRVPGTGQVGAGLVTPPVECFTAALSALATLSP
jgi:CheY-like chemotaxis protein